MAKLNITSTGTNPYGITEEDVERAFDNIIMEEEPEELSDADLIIEETGKTAEEYATMKGVEVTISRRQGSPVKGKLVEWDDPLHCRVVWMDGVAYVTKTFPLDELKKLNPFLEGSLAKMQASRDARNQLTSLFEDSNIRPVNGLEINNGGRAETLDAAIRTFELPGGIEGVAATSIAGYKYETEKDEAGNDVPKNRNDDVWVVDPLKGFVAVVDGLGGGKRGTRAAEIVATSLSRNEGNVAEGAKAAQAQLAADPEFKSADGAVFLSARVQVGQPIEIGQAGDVDLYHFDAKGKVKYSPDHYAEMNQPPQSLLDQIDKIDEVKLPAGLSRQDAIRQFIKMAAQEMTAEKTEGLERIIKNYEAGRKPMVETSNPLYTDVRRAVMMGINKKQADVATFRTKNLLEEGDWVLLISDGVSDNFPPGDLERYVRMAVEKNWTPEQFTKKLSQVLDERIKMKAKDDPIALQNHYKLDNATIIAMRVKGKRLEKASVKAA